MTEYATICYGETYTWNGQTYSTKGEYSVTLTNTLGCDSTATLVLTILPAPVTETESVTIGSDELPYIWRGQSLTATGQYTATEPYTTAACDSAIHILDLTVLTTGALDEQFATICETEVPYIWYSESYSTTGKYTYTEQYAGTDIDSIQHILNLTVNPTIYAEETKTACDSYTWNGETFTTSGDYIYTTTAANGCDSITTLHLTINYTQYAEETKTACDSYTWNGETYTQSGDYTYTTTAANGCDSVTTLHLTINYTQYAEETKTACDSYTWNGETYTTSGDYIYTTTAANGCDSITTLHLTINYTQYAEETKTACDSYTWNGETYTQSGDYTYTTTAKNGCDSITTLHLTINYTQYAEETKTACDSYTWNGETYTTSGDYTYTTTAANDCDSITTLHLTINYTQYAEESKTACDSYTWNGETYTQSGDYIYTTTAANGCDSITTLHLTINYTQYAEETKTACDSYTWNDETYTTSGDYTYTTTAANGCDSITTLHLTINQSEVGEMEYATICYGETYTWNGQNYSATGEYNVTLSNINGCDSVATLSLTIMPEAITTTETIVIGSDQLPYTWHGQSLSATGRYTDIEQYAHVACDSAIHILDLTVLTTGALDEQFATICETEVPYIWYSESYSTTGKYTYTEQYAGTDIDSIQHILNLTVNPTIYAEETKTACDSYTWNGETYTTSGDYIYTTTAANGCDSVTTLHLTINYTQYAEETKTACDSYTWNGETYTQSGDYIYTTTAANGCDSITTLHLTINYRDTAFFTETACDSYEWHGTTYTTSGEYEYHTTTVLGCDSIEVLYLTILPPTQYFTTDTILCYGEACEWRGYTQHEAGVYHDTLRNILECDSIIYTLRLAYWDEVPTSFVTDTMAGPNYYWNGMTYTEAGEYAITLTDAHGCDSVVVLNLFGNAAAIDNILVYEQCAGSGVQEVEILTQGFIDYIAITATPEAKAAGLRDTVMMLSPDNLYELSYTDVRAGIHEMRASAIFHNEVVAEASFQLTFLYPTTIFDQRHSDLIAILTPAYNGGYDFTTFQWYKDGELLFGETHSYLNQTLTPGAEYSALLTESNGLQLMSCPFMATLKELWLVYPTIVHRGEAVTYQVPEHAIMYLYDSNGHLVEQRMVKANEKGLIYMPYAAGIYQVLFISDDQMEHHAKILVQ